MYVINAILITSYIKVNVWEIVMKANMLTMGFACLVKSQIVCYVIVQSNAINVRVITG